MFKEITNRDAWSTIRGFVYQVDMTILRWLSLANWEILELEKGEDIDIIKGGLEVAENSRVLEQVKYQDATLSLNTELALELLYNFFLHKQNNLGQKISFRFVSNAGYNIERPTLFPNGESAIAVWQKLFSEDDVDASDDRVQVIKKHLVKKIAEKITDPLKTEEKDKQTQKNWQAFKALVENHVSLLEFIKEFEWSLESPESAEITDHVKAEIDSSVHFRSPIDAEALYPRLFLYVFRLLTNSGPKTLDIAGLLAESLLPVLTAEEDATFQMLSRLLTDVQGRVSEAEANIAASFKQIATLTEDMLSIKNSDAVFEVRLKNLSTTPPAHLRNGSTRKGKTNEIITIFETTTLINFQGINGTGKTQLAALICPRFGNIHWVELREYNDSPEKSTLLIEALLSVITGIPTTRDRSVWIANVVAQLPKNTIIVINDLPQIDNSSPLKEVLILLASNLPTRQSHLLTTSNYKIPISVCGSLAQHSFQEYYDFVFNDEEISEVLTNNGAPAEILKYSSFFASVSHRNPQILLAIVSRLAGMDWGKDSLELFEVLFNKEFSADILKDAQSSITRFITDGHMKELLYRLTLIHYDYSFEIVRAVSEVEEKVNSPFEKLQGITNIWIEENGDAFKTSPIIHNLGINNLSPKIVKSTYSAVARAILGTKKVNVITASRIITAFINAEEYNDAGFVLLNVLRSAETEEAIKNLQAWGYLDYWGGTSLPQNIAPILKAYLTAEQIRLHTTLGEDITAFTERLNKICLDTTDISEKVTIHIIILSNAAARDLHEYLEHVKYVFENVSELSGTLREAISNELLEGFLWIPIQQLYTEEEVTNWLEAVDLFEAKTGVPFFTNEMTEVGVTVLAEHIVRYEKENALFEPSLLASRLDALIKYFEARNLETLIAVFLKERIALEFQVIGNTEGAEEITVEWSEKFSSIEAKYLLSENLGKLYFNDKKNPKNTVWLENAIASGLETHVTFADTLAYGAASISESNSPKAVSYMEKAVELTKNTPWSSDLDNVQMISELGVAYWKNGEFERSYRTFNDAMTRLQAIKSEQFGPYWIRLLSWMAHTLGYISAAVAKDTVPAHFRDGAEYTKPYQGIFLFNTKDLTEYYTPSKDILMLTQMAVFSEGVGDIEEAYKWSLRAYDEARKTGDQNLIMMVAVGSNQYPLINFKIDEHFEMALQFHAISAHVTGTPEEKHAAGSKINYENLVASKPSDEWDATEKTLFTLSIIPMFIMVLNAFNNDASLGRERAKALLKLMKNYAEDASDRQLWKTAYALMSKIFAKDITPEALIAEGNFYGDNDDKNFQTICILGYIYLNKDSATQIAQIVNVFPHLTKIFSNMPAISRNILVPFVKFYSLRGVEENYVGSRDELREIAAEIDGASTATVYAIQKLLQIVVEVSNVDVQGERKNWLIHFKEI